MSLDFWYRKNYFTGSAMMRHCSEWILCVLLLVLCVSAKMARYEIQKPTLKLATTQAYLDGEETLRKLPKTGSLVLVCRGDSGFCFSPITSDSAPRRHSDFICTQGI